MRLYIAGTHTYGWMFPDDDRGASLISRTNMLESYYYVKPWQTERMGRFKRFLLDSGAFTALYGAGMAAEDLPSYVDAYIGYISENKVPHFFEMDVDRIVGYRRVLEFRREIEQQTGTRCIPVWHLERGKRDFQQMCADYPYVAIGGIATREGRKALSPHIPWFTAEAHRLGARIHGLGYTDIRAMPSTGFDSVDSTAWLYGSKGGFVYRFDGSCVGKVMPPRGKRMNWAKCSVHNFEQWVRFSEYLEKGDEKW